jgi:hypothetical protein
MSKFSIRISDRIGHTRIKLYNLVINKTCQIDEFEDEISSESSLANEVDKLYNILRKVCDLKMLPKTMFRLIHTREIPFQLYEAKSKNLRFYLIKLEKTGKVIVLGGRKNNQKADFKYLVKLVNDIHSEGINTY